jgi:hypothetical protein
MGAPCSSETLEHIQNATWRNIPEIRHLNSYKDYGAFPQEPTFAGTGNGTPEVPELPSAWGYNWATQPPGGYKFWGLALQVGD